MALTKKASMQANTFTGLSALFAVKNGITFTSGAASIETAVEFPVSNESDGFRYNGGTPSVDHFKVHGLSGDWTNRFTPGESELNVEIPTHDTNILEYCGFTQVGSAQSVTLDGKTYSGKPFAETSKVVILGLAGLNDTEDKLFLMKKVRCLATINFDPSGVKPLSVTLTGANACAADADSVGIYDVTSGNGG